MAKTFAKFWWSAAKAVATPEPIDYQEYAPGRVDSKPIRQRDLSKKERERQLNRELIKVARNRSEACHNVNDEDYQQVEFR